MTSSTLSCVSLRPYSLCVFCICGHVYWTTFSSYTRNRGRRSLAAFHTRTSYACRDYSSDWRRCCNSGKDTCQCYWARTVNCSDWSCPSIRNLQENVRNSSEFDKESRWPSINIIIALYIEIERDRASKEYIFFAKNHNHRYCYGV